MHVFFCFGAKRHFGLLLSNVVIYLEHRCILYLAGIATAIILRRPCLSHEAADCMA